MTSAWKCFALLSCLLIAACANSPVAIHDRYDSGLLVELSAGTSPAPVKLGFVSARELYVISPELRTGTEAKSAIVFLQNGYDQEEGYFLRHGVATGAAATNLATKEQSLRLLQSFASDLTTMTREEALSFGEAAACLKDWAEDEENAAELPAAATRFGAPDDPALAQYWLTNIVPQMSPRPSAEDLLELCGDAS